MVKESRGNTAQGDRRVISLCFPVDNKSHVMRFQLGIETIVARTTVVFTWQSIILSNKVTWFVLVSKHHSESCHSRSHLLIPISLPVKGKKNFWPLGKNGRNCNKISAQVFYEMLDQVCHKPFYENTFLEYQEVSSIYFGKLTLKGVGYSWKTWRRIHLLYQFPQWISSRHLQIRT